MTENVLRLLLLSYMCNVLLLTRQKYPHNNYSVHLDIKSR